MGIIQISSMKTEVNLKGAKRNGKQIKLGTKTDFGIMKWKRNKFRKLDNNLTISYI